MSERNVELHRRAIEAFNARDIERLIALCDPGVEWNSTFAAVGVGVYHGHRGVRRWQRDTEDVWGTEIRADPEAFFDLGERTLAFHALHGRGRGSGVEVATPGAQVAKWRGGLITYYKAYPHREDALRDLGVSEDELERIDPR
jgi:ketosteroid isomerase-like protein